VYCFFTVKNLFTNKYRVSLKITVVIKPKKILSKNDRKRDIRDDSGGPLGQIQELNFYLRILLYES
jgi:hypothetical protein